MVMPIEAGRRRSSGGASPASGGAAAGRVAPHNLEAEESVIGGILFTGALLTEIIFSLDGLGLLGFEAVINRDYPIVFGTLYIYTLIGLLLNLISDLTYVAIDPRIDFGTREV